MRLYIYIFVIIIINFINIYVIIITIIIFFMTFIINVICWLLPKTHLIIYWVAPRINCSRLLPALEFLRFCITRPAVIVCPSIRFGILLFAYFHSPCESSEIFLFPEGNILKR